jgi:thiosulfate/3-mercaptopyruvate sulfurtransferase
MSEARSRTLISIAGLAALLEAGAPVVLLDVLDEQGAAPTDRARIPGALSVHLASHFSGKPTKTSGKRPLPEIMDLQADARRWGISPGVTVVVYDATGGAQASRAWWTLRWAGFETVRILDGGFAVWKASGRPVSHDHVEAADKAGVVRLTPGHMPTLTAADAAALAREGVLLDARGRAGYVAGHIPGALSAPSGDNLDASGAFKADADLHAGFAALGDQTLGVYCGSGNAAAHAIAALSAAGLAASLYVGSWTAWTTDPSRPAATGPERG